MRLLHALGLGYIAVCGGLLIAPRKPAVPLSLAGPQPGPVSAETVTVVTPPHPVQPITPGNARAWFEQAKPFCNALEVVTRIQYAPPPNGTGGTGFGAACYALAGKVDSAQALIDRLGGGERSQAAAIVFEVGHPVADAGDNRSAGPMMALVVAYQPDNYMALYHAGMAEFATGDRRLARKHLTRFLTLYSPEDGWRSSAQSTLQQIADP
jgi:hypothetical protein